MSGAFTVVAPDALQAVQDLLATDDEAMCMSGGATLVPMLNAGLVEPSLVVSLKKIPALSGISRNTDNGISIGAMTRHVETAASELLVGSLAGVRNAASKIANPVVRNMGTMGGSISFADPGADYPPALVASGAEIEILSTEGGRRVPAQDFFVDWYETALEPGEIVYAIHLPPADETACGYHEKFARVEGDFATVSVNVVLALAGENCKSIRIAVGACGPTPVRNADVEQALVGKPLSREALLEAGKKLAAECDPVDDVRGSAEYRLNLVPQLVTRAALNAQALLQDEGAA